MRKSKIILKSILSLIIALLVALGVYNQDEIVNLFQDNNQSDKTNVQSNTTQSYDMDAIPAYAGQNYVVINDNKPEFTEQDYTTETFENYSELDSLGRCGVAYANISQDTMPTEERGSIGMIKPTGWHTIKYDNINGKYLYNRCHLIGYQLSGENANEKNLITCTRQMNTEGMLDFENQIAEYVENTGNHVLYRVTPVFEEDNLLATGVQMEAMSVEDKGQGVSFNIFVYNVQDGIEIDYSNGDSHQKE